MANAKGGLGRGLESLLGEASAEVGGSAAESQIALSKIRTNPGQPRKEFDRENLEELADSIKQNGVLQPILLRPVGNRYEIVAGERRFQAAKIAGLSEIPAVVRTIDDDEVFQLALIENLQRADLNPVEEALGYKKLLDDKALTQEGLAKALSKSRPAISNSLRLLELPAEVLDMVSAGELSAGHARAILSVPDTDGRVRLAHKAKNEHLSVRQLEAMAPLYAAGKEPKTQREPTPAEYKRAARRLRRRLEAGVRIHRSRGKNRIEIEFEDDADLARILAILEGKQDVQKD